MTTVPSRLRFAVLGFVLGLSTSAAVQPQVPTGSIAGHVGTADAALPGASVSVTSENLQGSRKVTTSGSGDFVIPTLPPGDYTITVEAQGFRTATRAVHVSAGTSVTEDFAMAAEGVTEEIVVTAGAETVATTPQASLTLGKSVVEALPIERNIRETTLLTPGVADTGPGNNARGNRGLVIAGSQSYENLFLVNGVVVNENLRGQPFDLFIEDAIQETTTSTSGISAEYGRFAGGVINTITRSGGNEFHGSLRDSLTNDRWTSATALTTSRTDKIDDRYEGTLGGRFVRDRLWFFAAGRNFKQNLSGQTVAPTRIAFPVINDEKRYEGKLTFSFNESHRFIGSYINIDRSEDGNFFGNILDTASVVNRQVPQDLMALSYTGNFSDNFYAEALYSKRNFTFKNSGSTFTDRIKGTLLVDTVTGNRWNSPTFCGVCREEERNNENLVLKGSLFASSSRLGSHEVVFGYDTFKDVRAADNHQSGSDFRIIITNSLVNGTTLAPQLISGNSVTYIQWNPILVSSRGTDFKTNSLFVNDRWRLGERWTFNLGLRYDQNDGVNSQGQKTAKDSRVSPRLGAAWDVRGDGDWIATANFAHYVTAIANTQADSTSVGGNPATYQWFYRGPSINAPGSPLVSTADALAQIFAWFDGQGGTANTTNLRAIAIPGGTTVIRGSLDSPYTEELSVGVSKSLGGRGLVRLDLVHRESKAFYSTRTDLSTGQVKAATGANADLSVLENTDKLERKYDGLHGIIQYRVGNRLNLAASLAYSKTKGNVNGETFANGPVSASAFQYPEYTQRSWNLPSGYLASDQRTRGSVWAVWDAYQGDHHKLSVSLLEHYASGLPYGAVGAVDPRPYVTNPGYVRPPSAVTYYYTSRDAFRTDTITATDLSLNYSFAWKAFGTDLEVFVQPEILNVLNEHGVLNVGTGVLDATNTTGLARFNPFTSTPVEGTNWQKSSTFGKPVLPNDYQLPRTYRFSVGIRF